MAVIRRSLAALAAVVCLLIATVAAALYATLPNATNARIPGLAAPVTIAFDPHGIPAIRAQSDLDAAVALGYLHARDRMFQMELMRRAASGRISEIAGPATFQLDLTMRIFGLRRRAAADFPFLPAHTQAMLAAYSRGVNAYIAQRGRFAAPEFLLLGAPEPWTPLDCLMWGKTMGYYLSANFYAELARAALATHLPAEKIQQLWPAAAAPETSVSSIGPLPAALVALLPRAPSRFTLPTTASNEWAVDGAHSATGAPLLAGDPHLSFGQPGLWYLVRIDIQPKAGPDMTLAGATAPGVPFIILGRNSAIAWTLTTTAADTQDIFVETPVDATHYATPTGPAAYLTYPEIIHIAGGPDRTITVRETRHGPVISDLAPAAAHGRILALSAANLAPQETAPAGIDALDQATTIAEAGRAAAEITSPVNNLLVADAHTIALFTTGRVPIRKAGDGENLVDGASGTYDWQGFATGAQLPHIVAPASGRIVNANEPVILPPASPPTAFMTPAFMTHDAYIDARAARIRQLLDAHPHATVADFTAMQIDSVSLLAQHLLPVLLAVPPPTATARTALTLLSQWHGEMDRALPQPLIFNAWLQLFELRLLARAQVPIDESGSRGQFVNAVLTGGQSSWCAPANTPVCTSDLQASLSDALTQLTKSYGPDPSAWHWGNAHQAVFAHPLLAHLPILGPLTTLHIQDSGGDDTVGRAAMAESEGLSLTATHGASYRAAYDLSNLDRSRYIITPGQSANLLSAHRSDLLKPWRDGDTVLLPAIPSQIQSSLILTAE